MIPENVKSTLCNCFVVAYLVWPFLLLGWVMVFPPCVELGVPENHLAQFVTFKEDGALQKYYVAQSGGYSLDRGAVSNLIDLGEHLQTVTFQVPSQNGNIEVTVQYEFELRRCTRDDLVDLFSKVLEDKEFYGGNSYATAYMIPPQAFREKIITPGLAESVKTFAATRGNEVTLTEECSFELHHAVKEAFQLGVVDIKHVKIVRVKDLTI